jgi:transcriptional regulator with XRE-family HTH domain
MKRQKSLRQLAKEIAISPSYLSMILNGQRKCPPELINKLQPILGVHNFVNNQLQEVFPKQKVASSNLVSRSSLFRY